MIMEALIFVVVVLGAWIIYYNKKHGEEEQERYQAKKAQALLELQERKKREEQEAEKEKQEAAIRRKQNEERQETEYRITRMAYGIENPYSNGIHMPDTDESLRKAKELEDAKLQMIDSLNNGVIPPECSEFPKDKSPILFTKSERFIMGWLDVTVSTTRTKTRMTGGSAGFSLRIAKGVSVRTGRMRGHAERYEDVENLGRCQVFITDRNLYVQSRNGRVKKCPTSQIVAINPTPSGLQVEFNRLLPLFFEIKGTDKELMRTAMSYYVRFMDD